MRQSALVRQLSATTYRHEVGIPKPLSLDPQNLLQLSLEARSSPVIKTQSITLTEITRSFAGLSPKRTKSSSPTTEKRW